MLNSTELDSFGAESLLIGGIRNTGADGTTVAVATGNLTVANAGTPLTGTDVILVANDTLTLAPGAAISAIGHARRGSRAAPARQHDDCGQRRWHAGARERRSHGANQP